MKKTFIAIIAAVLLGTIGVTMAFAGGDKKVDDDLHIAEKGDEGILSDAVVNEDLADFEEYEKISEEIDLDHLTATVVEDNQGKRVLLFADEAGQEQYKTVFVKKDNYLKIISFGEGQIFHGKLDGSDQASQAEVKVDNQATSDLDKAETDTVSNHIDLSKYTGKVVEDNKNKRVIVYVDANGHEQYKSIFLKHKNIVKVIDFDGGLVYEGTIGKDTATAPKQDKVEKTDKQAAAKKEEPKKEETKQTETSSISQYPESSTIASHIDLNKYTGKVVEDNKGKRVIVFSDSNGHKQYKSIYVKRNDHLKIIDFNGGMIYKG